MRCANCVAGHKRKRVSSTRRVGRTYATVRRRRTGAKKNFWTFSRKIWRPRHRRVRFNVSAPVRGRTLSRGSSIRTMKISPSPVRSYMPRYTPMSVQRTYTPVAVKSRYSPMDIDRTIPANIKRYPKITKKRMQYVAKKLGRKFLPGLAERQAQAYVEHNFNLRKKYDRDRLVSAMKSMAPSPAPAWLYKKTKAMMPESLKPIATNLFGAGISKVVSKVRRTTGTPISQVERRAIKED